ncbi:hypothetical protein [Okeania sp. SIO1F9]|uniref:hypothetical protein n=1 Tax=Okeania sp. SIO1F9 TaxID=2607813 RepID=UPI00144BC82F|nr:hypothetical protein [Okeania sp. SIO1F9]NET75596.1 hypothetical protein [Okeania sp. SIO1F9]
MIFGLNTFPQESGVRSQESGVRSQESGVRREERRKRNRKRRKRRKFFGRVRGTEFYGALIQT